MNFVWTDFRLRHAVWNPILDIFLSLDEDAQLIRFVLHIQRHQDFEARLQATRGESGKKKPKISESQQKGNSTSENRKEEKRGRSEKKGITKEKKIMKEKRSEILI